MSLTLIAIGVIIFIGKLTSFKSMDLLFTLWPIIIIALGLEIILSSNSRDKNHKITNNLDIISISVIIIILTILAALNLSSELFNANYNYTDYISEEIIVDENKKIIIEESNIDIEVLRSDNEEIKVRLEGEYRHNDKVKNREKLLKVTQTDGATRVSRKVKPNKAHFVSINTGNMKYVIELPSKVEIELLSSYGDIRVNDVESNLVINSSYSDIELENIKGSISIENSYGDISGENLDGNIDIESNMSDVNIDSSFSKDININSQNGDVNLKLDEEQVGRFNLVAAYGEIEDNLGFNVIESASTDSINEVRKIMTPVFDIRSDKGDIIIETD